MALIKTATIESNGIKSIVELRTYESDDFGTCFEVLLNDDGVDNAYSIEDANLLFKAIVNFQIDKY
jgi:hypothetical protein